MNVTETAIRTRYAAGAQEREEALCCPVKYNPEYLQALPREVIERDYGCGDPSPYLKPGETVLDLGSGTGKICFIASQIVGPEGRVIGVDMTDEMLEVARRNAPLVANKIGFANVEFRKGRIQDLALDLDVLDAELAGSPLDGAGAFLAAEALAEALRRRKPMIATESVDVVVSNCVLNLVDANAKAQMFGELFRVLRNGGRAVISDIVSHQPVPAHLQADPELWSGCISGAIQEQHFLAAFHNAGFRGLRIESLQREPWKIIEGVEFRSITVQAFKWPSSDSSEETKTAVYLGPFAEVVTDDGQIIRRGERIRVTEDAAARFARSPYDSAFVFPDALPSPREASCSEINGKCC